MHYTLFLSASYLKLIQLALFTISNCAVQHKIVAAQHFKDHNNCTEVKQAKLTENLSALAGCKFYGDAGNNRGFFMDESVQMDGSSQLQASPQTEPVAAQEASQPTEKMLPQSQVNRLVGEIKRETADKVRREYEAKYAQQAQPQQTMGGMQQMSPDEIRNLIAQATKEQQDKLAQEYVNYAQQQQAQELVNRFKGKIESGKGKYADFDDKVAKLQLGRIPAIVQLADSVDNTADVIYDLADNPHKIANILQFASNPDTVHLAEIAMHRLSQSIKDNEAAKQLPNARAPLSQIRPSNAGTDNGVKGVKDLRKLDWMRA